MYLSASSICMYPDIMRVSLRHKHLKEGSHLMPKDKNTVP